MTVTETPIVDIGELSSRGTAMVGLAQRKWVSSTSPSRDRRRGRWVSLICADCPSAAPRAAVPSPNARRAGAAPVEHLSSFRPDALAAARRARGLSLAAVAQRLGPPIDRARVWQWENGLSTPSPSTLIAIADVVATPAATLIGLEDTDPRTLEHLRILSGHTRPAFAAQLALPRSTYDRLERGNGRRELPAALIDVIARVLRLPATAVSAAYAETRRQCDEAQS